MKWFPADVPSSWIRAVAGSAVVLPLVVLPFASESLAGQRVLLVVWPLSVGLLGLGDFSASAIAVVLVLLLLNVVWYLALLTGLSRLLRTARRYRGTAR